MNFILQSLGLNLIYKASIQLLFTGEYYRKKGLFS